MPSVLGLRSRGALERLYRGEHLSDREIERLLGVSYAEVLEALDRFGIPPHVDGHQRTGPLPFGLDYQDHRLVTNSAEQAALRMMQEQQASGLTLREIAGDLTLRLIPTKQNGIWQANTVRRYLPVREPDQIRKVWEDSKT